MRRLISFFFMPIFLIFSSCAFSEAEVHYASLVELVVNPSKYEGRVVSFKGYHGHEYSPFVFISKEHVEMRDLNSGVSLDAGSLGQISNCLIGYIEVSGLFSKASDGYKVIRVDRIHNARSGKKCEHIPW